MYEKQLEELRSVTDKIRSGAYNAEKKTSVEGTSIVKRASQRAKEREAEVKEEEETFANSFETSMLDTMVLLRETPPTYDYPEYEERESSSGQARPKGREDYYQDSKLTEDPAFMSEVERLQEKYPGLTKSELFRTIQGESGFNPKARNKDTDAAGLFQFIPSTAAELGYTTEDIVSMEPAEQVRVYEKYLDRWGYNGNVALGIMQAAPAYANAGLEDVIYSKGTKAWEQNPGWRPSDGGDITVASINSYYRGQ